MKIFNVGEIQEQTFFKKGLSNIDEPFGNFLICGRMGTGKTYLAVKIAYELRHKYKIKSNIKSLVMPGYLTEYFEKLEEIYNDFEEHTIFIIDELGKKYTKDSKQDKDFYNWLQMSRKCKRIVLLIHQEYLLVPNWLRGACIECYTTTKIPLLHFLPIFITYRGYPTLDPNTLEWVIDSNYWLVYKRNQEIGKLYKTFETVAML